MDTLHNNSEAFVHFFSEPVEAHTVLHQLQTRNSHPADPTHAPESAGPTGQTGDTVDPRAYMRSLLRHGLLPALRSDPDVSRAFFRSFNLLAAPGDVMSDPKILGVVLQHYQQRGERVEPTLGPNRAGMLDAFGDAH